MTAIQCNDGGANVTRDGGRDGRASSTRRPASSTWSAWTSSIRICSTVRSRTTRRSSCRASRRLLRVRSPGAGVDAGLRLRDRRHRADARREGDLGRVQGRGRALQRRDGAVAGPLDPSQNRYGHHPKDIKYRFPRQTVIVVSAHDPKTVYQASHVVHRTRDEG